MSGIISFFMYQRCWNHREALLFVSPSSCVIVFNLTVMVCTSLKCDKVFLESVFETEAETDCGKWAELWLGVWFQHVHLAIIFCGLPEHYNLQNQGLVCIMTVNCSGSLCITVTENHLLHCFHICST